MATEIPIKIQIVKSLSTANPSRIVAVKADGDDAFSLFVTDKTGIPYPLKGLQNNVVITNTDGNLQITSSSTSTNINLASSILATINLALQSGDNISELVNDVGYLTAFTETDPIFQASEASLFVSGDKANLDNQSGVNSGNQTSIVGISGTKAQFNTELTDGDFLFVGDAVSYTDEEAQDAVGTILADTSTIDFTYDDTTPAISANVKLNSIDATHLSNTINNSEFVNDSNFVNQTALDLKLDKSSYTGNAKNLDDRIIVLENLQDLSTNFTGQAYAIWTGVGLIFDVIYPDYYIEGILFSGATEQVTLSASDPSLPRLDIIAVDVTGAIVITGTPAIDPSLPTIDNTNQIQVSAVLVNAGATTPEEITEESVYKENTEWTTSSNNGTVNFNATTSPFQGTKHIDCGAFTNGQYLRFVNNTILQTTDFPLISLKINLKSIFSNSTKFSIRLYNGVTSVSSIVTIDSGSYNFIRTTINTYQSVIIPMSAFTLTSSSFDRLDIIMVGSNSTGFRLDNIVLAEGVSTNSPLQKAIISISTNSGVANATQSDDIFTLVGAGKTTTSASGKTITITTPTEVAQTITNGVTITAPSENTVFDALALKYDASNPSGYISDVNISYTPSSTNGIIVNDKGTDATIPTVDFTNAGLLTPEEKQLLYNNSATGITKFGGFSINVDTTKYNTGLIEGWFVDNTTNPNIPTKVFKSFPATTGNALTNIATQNVTYIAVDINGVHQQSGVPFESEAQRPWIPLGGIVHSNRTNINAVNNQPVVALSPNNQLSDLMESIGFFNISGNVFTPNGVNLSINKSAGHVFKQGANFINDNKDPHTLGLTSLIAPSSLRYRTQTGTEFANTNVIDAGFYDLAGVRTAIPGTRWSIQRIYLFQSNLVRIQYGQATYTTQAEAIQAITTEPFVVEQNILENGLFRALLIVREGATDLTDINRALFIEASKFGSVAGLGSLSTTNLQQAYNNSLTPEITTNSTLGAVSIRRGSAGDTDNVLEIENGAGTVTSTIKGNGALTALTYNGYTPENVANKDNGTLSTSTTTYPTSGAVKTAVDLKVDKNTAITGATNTKITYDSKGLVTAGTSLVAGDIPNIAESQVTNLVSDLALKAPLASPTFTGTPTVPTATAGTNTTQIATTAFVLANTQPLISHLEYNNTNKTIWNNGLGNLIFNTSFGEWALNLNTTGDKNSVYGYLALGSNTIGNNNVAIGERAGYHSNSISGSQNQGATKSIFLGGYTTAKENNAANTNEIVIGFEAIGQGSNTVTLGNTSITSTRLRGSVLGGSFVKDGASSTNILLAGGSDIPQSTFQTALTNPVTGTGIANYIPKWTGTGTQGNSSIFDNGSNVGIGTSSATGKFQVGDGTTSLFTRIFGTSSDLYMGQGSGLTFGVAGNANNIIASDSSFPLCIGSFQMQPIIFGLSNTEYMRLTTSGDLKIKNLSGTGPAQLMTDASGNVSRSVGYKVYTALLTQTGTNAPVATVLDNTLGATITWTYNTTGQYIATLSSGTWNTAKTLTLLTFGDLAGSSLSSNLSLNNGGTTGILYTFSGTTASNGMMVRHSIEIRVYN